MHYEDLISHKINYLKIKIAESLYLSYIIIVLI